MQNFKILPKLLLWSDICFVIVFALGVWLEHSSELLLYVLLSIILISYYPLYNYCKKWTTETYTKDESWHHDSEYIVIFYSITRGFVLFYYIMITVIHTANIDIYHIIIHLSFFTQVTIIIMLILFIIIFFIAVMLNNRHTTLSRMNSTKLTINDCINDINNDDKILLIPFESANSVTKKIINNEKKKRTKESPSSNSLLI